MKIKHLKKIESYQNLHAVMEKNLLKWSENGQFKKSYDRFTKNLKKLDDLKASADQELTGQKEKLKKTRKDITEMLMPVVNIMGLYARDSGKNPLKKKLTKISSQVAGMSHLSLTKNVNRVISKVASILETEHEQPEKKNPLSGYGLNMSLIKDLQNKNLQYGELANKLKDSSRKTKKAEKEILGRIRENDKLLKGRIHKFMGIYGLSDPDFYQAYIDAIKSRKDKTAQQKPISPAPVKKKTETTPPPPQAKKARAGRPPSTGTRKRTPAKKASTTGRTAAKTTAKRAASTGRTASKAPATRGRKATSPGRRKPRGRTGKATG